MTNEELTELLAECLGISPSRLTADTIISEVDVWDSVAWLAIITTVDEKLKFTMRPSEIGDLKTVGDLIEYIQQGASRG